MSWVWHFFFSLLFQLKEKKEKFEKEQAKKKDEFKSGRIVGKVSSIDLPYVNYPFQIIKLFKE